MSRVSIKHPNHATLIDTQQQKHTAVKHLYMMYGMMDEVGVWPGVAVTILGAVMLVALLIKSTIPAVPAELSSSSSSSSTPPNSTTQQVCTKLVSQFPGVTYTRQDSRLWQVRQTYWAAQARAPTPALVVRPSSVKQLTHIVKILAAAVTSAPEDEPVRFAVRSGGHSPVQGFANVDAGIVIDLGNFNEIKLAEDRKSVSIGPGATWGEVYRNLEKFGLAVAGGRASSVGVGGLTLGGGLSFFSPQVGFVCDTIVEFEVVLADGTILIVSDTSYAELAIALRGGGNNFGIVTRMKARTFPQAKIWFGHLYHWPNESNRLIQTFYDFGKSKPYDNKATCIFCFAWAPYLPFPLPITCCTYTDPVASPPALRGFTKARRFWNTLGVRSLAESTDRIEKMSVSNLQDLFHTTTFENDLATLHCAHKAFKDSLAEIKNVPGVVWTLVFQPIVPSATLHHATNSTGLNTTKTLTVMHVNVVWNYSEDDPIIHAAAETLLKTVEDFAKGRGVYHPWKYINYCSASQNPYETYGSERHSFLRDVSSKYDPDGIFQKAVPGHKLWNRG